MQRVLLLPVLAFTALAMSAPLAAQASGQRTATVCLNLDGSTRGPTCHKTSTWRQDDICNCPGTTDQVTAPLCAPGESPAPESADANRARHAAVHNGSLMGATYNGKRFCVRPESTPR
ncbi:MAG TPA: hypothetical protein VG407_03640 [Caulobacteraceae bacterium]|jgi:hypothetical protein|nr:hypothetical protein [Caulobacteraceae bacterium]